MKTLLLFALLAFGFCQGNRSTSFSQTSTRKASSVARDNSIFDTSKTPRLSLDFVGASKAAKSSGALSFVNRRKLPALESALDLVPVGVVDEKALTENSAGPVTCKTSPSPRVHCLLLGTPARNLDFDFGRAGTISVVRYDTTAFECANHCRQGDEGSSQSVVLDFFYRVC